MKNYWLEFIRQREPTILEQHFTLNRLYWQQTRGHVLFKEDGYYGVSRLEESKENIATVIVHITSVDHQQNYAIDLFELFWKEDPLAIDLYAYLHSDHRQLLQRFCLYLERAQARQDHRRPRLLPTRRIPIDALLLSSEHPRSKYVPYRKLYCVK